MDSEKQIDLGSWMGLQQAFAVVSRQHADHLIHQYAEFGDVYFRLSEIARVSPRTYRQIAAHVDDQTIEIDGQKLELTPANASRIRAAIQSLRQRARPAAAATRPPADLIELQVRVDALVADIAKSVRALNAVQSRNPHRRKPLRPAPRCDREGADSPSCYQSGAAGDAILWQAHGKAAEGKNGHRDRREPRHR